MNIFSLKSTRRGFTLIELLVAVSIIGLMTAIITANLSSARGKARDAKRIADLEQIKLALEVYHQAYGEYPCETASSCSSQSTTANGLVGEGAGLDALLSPLLSSIPYDPLGPGNTTYRYYYDGSHTCSSGVKAVIFATNMEQVNNANWSAACGGSDSEGGAGTSSYILIVGNSSG